MSTVIPKPLPTINDYGEYAIHVEGLTFAYEPNNIILNDFNLSLPTGSRSLLIGANGSGKSTLMRILAGRHLVKAENTIKVLGLNAFRDTKLNFHRAYLDCDWGMRTVAFAGTGVPLMADIPVHKMMERLQQSYPERRDELVEMLGIDLNWRMHQLSDGQRRRVQLLLGLIRPFKILLLDEITTSLDVCVRQDLLRWLERESEVRKATIIYATHIFDGLDDWPTHLTYLTDSGNTGWQGKIDDLEYYQKLKSEKHPAKMLAVADHWLRKELECNREKRKFEKAQGDLAHELDPTIRQGGFASGRNLKVENFSEPINRRGTLSDMMGNADITTSNPSYKMKNTSIFVLALVAPAAGFSSSFSGLQMRSVSNSATMTMEYIPSGMSKEQWQKIKEAEKNKNKGKNLGQTGITSFKSRSFAEWQKAGGKNLFPVDPKKVKDPSQIPYMQRPGGMPDDSDLKKPTNNPFGGIFGKKKAPEPEPAPEPPKKNWWTL